MGSLSHAAAETLVADLRTVFGSRLRSVVAYGPHLDGDTDAPLTCLALVHTLSVEDLDACASLSAHWTRAHIATPLILPEDEFLKSLDAFPLEYGEIIRAHQDLLGSDPFEHLTIDREDLRRACETQVKSHLLHLRESFIEARGVPSAVDELVHTAAPAFAALLRNVAVLAGMPAADRAEATRNGARAAGIPEQVASEVLALEQPSRALMGDTARFFPEYLDAVERLSRAVDTWQAS
jgi:hypothetical protein